MKRDKRGFTLAELLVVVAIIAVLVAIAIPIFTSQLEKSREATDAANIRSQYAQVMTDAITEGGNVNGKETYGEIDLKQKKDHWQDETLGNNLHGLFQKVDGHPVSNGTAWVEYKASDSKVILHYEGEGSNNGGSSGGGNAGGNSGTGGTNGGDTSPSEIINSIDQKSGTWPVPNTEGSIIKGNAYKTPDGTLYIATTDASYNLYNLSHYPTESGWEWIGTRPSGTILTSQNKNGQYIDKSVMFGDIYKDDSGKLYIWTYGQNSPAEWNVLAPPNQNWLEINQ